MKKITLLLSIGLYFTASFAIAETVEKHELTTPRGDKVELVLHLPEISSLAPVVVIAPGGNYHMDLPIFTTLAQKSPKKGIATVRFNWNYTSTGGERSDDLSEEIEDMLTVVEFVKKDPRLDPTKIFLAGKSLGSVVNYQVFTQTKDAIAMFLLTPLCYEDIFEQAYPKFSEVTRPTVLLLGNKDEACPIDKLHQVSQKLGANVSTVVVGGDHGLNIGDWKDPAFADRNKENIDASLEILVHWMNIILGK